MNKMQFMFWQYRFSMIFLLAFLLVFLPRKYRKCVSGLIAAGCFIVTGAIDYVVFLVNGSKDPMLILTVLEMVVVQATAYILCCYRDFRALFTGISSATYVLPGNFISTGIFLYKHSMFLSILAQVLVHVILLIIVVVSLRSDYLNEMEDDSKLWRKLCPIPALFYAVFYSISYWPGSIYERKENWLSVIFLLLLMEATYVMIIKWVSQQRIESELERGIECLKTYAWGLRREADALRVSEEKMKILRHDSRHVYRMIGIYLEAGELNQIRRLLDQMDTELTSFQSRSFCKNIAVNGILLGCEAKAREENVQFICKASVPEKLQTVNEFELATVIFNLLENALSAASEVANPEERKITVHILPVKEQLMLEITNTFAGKCEFSKVTGLPLSNRGREHGYGLLSVKAYAGKHHAIVRYSVEDGMFCVRMLTER